MDAIDEWRSDEKQTAVIELLNQADDIHLHVDQLLKTDKSPQSRLEASKAFAMAAQIYHRAIDFIDADSEKKLMDHDRLAFLAYYGCGVSLLWGSQCERPQGQGLDDDDDDNMADEDDVMEDMDMLYRAVEIANNNLLNLYEKESTAYGIVAEDLETEGKYEKSYELFHKRYCICDMPGVDYGCIVSSGLLMAGSFLTAEKESQGDSSWLHNKAHTTINCLEKVILICDSALGDEDIRANYGRPDDTSLIEADKLTAEKWLEELKGKYPDADIGHADKARQEENSPTSLLCQELLKQSRS